MDNIISKILYVDHQIFYFLNSWVGHSHFLDQIFIFVGQYLVYFVPIFLIVLWFWSSRTKKIALYTTTAGLFAWVILANLVGAIHYRNRPATAQAHVKELVFHRPDRSFPSDHSAFLFAIAFTLWFFGYKKLSIAMFFLAIIISVSRIAIGVHYPTDVIAGFLIGIIAAMTVWYFRKPLDFVYNPIIKAAKKVRLA